MIRGGLVAAVLAGSIGTATAAAQLPGVDLPDVEPAPLPSLQLPVDPPELPLPEVSLPAVPIPVPTPSAELPVSPVPDDGGSGGDVGGGDGLLSGIVGGGGSTAGGGGSGGGGSGGGGSGGGGSGGGGSASAPDATGEASGGEGAGSAAPAAAGGGQTGAGSGGHPSEQGTTGSRGSQRRTGSRARPSGEAARRNKRRDRRLRRFILRQHGCLAALPPAERRVIVLRAGLDADRPRSRRRVAQVVDRSVRRVAMVERRGLRRLHGLARERRCAAPAVAAEPAAATVMRSLARALVTSLPGELLAAGDEVLRPSNHDSGDQDAGSGRADGSAGSRGAHGHVGEKATTSGLPGILGHSDGGTVGLILLALAAAGGLWLLFGPLVEPRVKRRFWR